MTVDCPYCTGTGKVKTRPSPVALTPLQRRIYNLLAATPEGIAVEGVIARVYTEPPVTARNSVWVTITNANKRLAPFKQRIVARGGWCTLKVFDEAK